MFFLAGLMGMMVLGSVAFASLPIAGETDHAEEDTDAQAGDGPGLSGEDAEPEDTGNGTSILDFATGEGGDAAVDETSEDAADAGSTVTASQQAASQAPVTQTVHMDIGLTPNPGPVSQTSTLFGRMGLINMPGLIEAGSDADDTLDGTDQTDLLNGGAGDDLIDARASDDELYGSDGNDTLLGGSENDTLHGGAGDDVLSGGADDDQLFGHDGNDVMSGDDGGDELWGGLGDDLMDGGDGDDALMGREGADTLAGGLGQDTLFGGWDNDLVIGVERGGDGTDQDEGDFLNGGDGADTLVAGEGDTVTGGDGADVFMLGDWIVDDAADLADFDAGEDQIVIVYDDAGGAATPDLTLRLNADDPAVTEIVVDGTVLGTLTTASAPDVSTIVLVGESAAGAFV
ncbi:calcium-binding protein [Tropicibacter sp. S64]|uniref:calcium-binding protein n=1 Tax=Tropicibacter sp. S64 TaxID=3415122 RepID=UPI003C7E9BD3